MNYLSNVYDPWYFTPQFNFVKIVIIFTITANVYITVKNILVSFS